MGLVGRLPLKIQTLPFYVDGIFCCAAAVALRYWKTNLPGLSYKFLDKAGGSLG